MEHTCIESILYPIVKLSTLLEVAIYIEWYAVAWHKFLMYEQVYLRYAVNNSNAAGFVEKG